MAFKAIVGAKRKRVVLSVEEKPKLIQKVKSGISVAQVCEIYISGIYIFSALQIFSAIYIISTKSFTAPPNKSYSKSPLSMTVVYTSLHHENISNVTVNYIDTTKLLYIQYSSVLQYYKLQYPYASVDLVHYFRRQPVSDIRNYRTLPPPCMSINERFYCN